MKRVSFSFQHTHTQSDPFQRADSKKRFELEEKVRGSSLTSLEKMKEMVMFLDQKTLETKEDQYFHMRLTDTLQALHSYRKAPTNPKAKLDLQKVLCAGYTRDDEIKKHRNLLKNEKSDLLEQRSWRQMAHLIHQLPLESSRQRGSQLAKEMRRTPNVSTQQIEKVSKFLSQLDKPTTEEERCLHSRIQGISDAWGTVLQNIEAPDPNTITNLRQLFNFSTEYSMKIEQVENVVRLLMADLIDRLSCERGSAQIQSQSRTSQMSTFLDDDFDSMQRQLGKDSRGISKHTGPCPQKSL